MKIKLKWKNYQISAQLELLLLLLNRPLQYHPLTLLLSILLPRLFQANWLYAGDAEEGEDDDEVEYMGKTEPIRVLCWWFKYFAFY